MTSKLRQLLVIIVGASAATACQDTPTETPIDDALFSSEHTVQEALYDMTDSFFVFSCDENGDPLPVSEGELIDMEGQIFERISVVRDGTGEFHFRLHTMPVGLRGVGVTSGETFRVDERDHIVASQRGLANSGSYRSTLKMRGATTHRTFWMVFSGSYRIGNDGELVRERNRESVICRI